MKRRKIILHGHLKKLWDGPIELVTETVAEAVEAFNKQTRAFEPPLGKARYSVKILGVDSDQDLFGPSDMEEIHIVPSFTGAKGGFFKIVIGAVLIAIAVWQPAALAFLGEMGFTMVAATGVSLTLGGILQLLAPQPRADTEESSAYLSGAQNTVKIGTRIPILYGEHRLYGHFLSYNVNAKDRIG